MRPKILILLLLVSSLFGYLEWGDEQSSFLFQAEYEFLKGLFSDPGSVFHPFTLIPFLGQILLLISVFQKSPNKILIIVGISCLGLLLGLMMFIGIMSGSAKIILSVLPFFVLAFLVLRHVFRKA